MSLPGTARSSPRNLVLAAMIFAVAMTFIDQTIVSIAVPEIQKELGLTSYGCAMGGQCLPTVIGGAIRLRWPAGGHEAGTRRWWLSV